MTSNSGDYSIVQDNSTGKEKAKPKSKRQQDPRLSFIYPNSETVVAEKDLKNEIDATSKEEPKDVPSSLEDNASFLSSALYWYLNPLFKIGQTRTLEHQDLGPASKQDRSETTYGNFSKYLEEEICHPKKKRSLWRVLIRTCGYYQFSLAIFYYGVYTACSFGPILILNALVKNFEGTDVLPTSTLWILVAFIFVIPMVGSIIAARSNVMFARFGLIFRNVLINKIYRKSLLLSPAARQASSSGQIVNMFSNDTAQIQRFMLFVNNCVLAVPTIAVCLYLIYTQVGPATFVGLALIIVIVPMNGCIFNLLNIVRRKKTVVTDRRVKLMNEILNGIRVIKYYAWEDAFSDKIEDIRTKELVYLKQSAYIIAVGFTVLLMAVPIFLPVLIFFTYSKLGNQLTAAKAFTSISLFNLMQFPFVFLPLGIAQYSQSLVSCKRMLDFFVLDEMADYVDKKPGDNDIVVSMHNASLGWISPDSGFTTDAVSVPVAEATVTKGEYSKAALSASELEKLAKHKSVDSIDFAVDDSHDVSVGEVIRHVDEDGEAAKVNRSIRTLTNVDFSVRKGELIAVVGPVGCGKSSLLSGLLGELILFDGTVQAAGSIAYCDQRPWILNDTLQNNVLFGHAYNESQFDAALFAANLEDDIGVLPGGVQTQIGEKGINLSGGQKARVSLARAIYCDADIYLLDDPLSAVDAHVGQFLFHECIRTALKGKTRILVTHQVHLLPYCDRIIVIQDGKIQAMGSYDELLSSGIDVAALVPVTTTEDAENGGELEASSSAEESKDRDANSTRTDLKKELTLEDQSKGADAPAKSSKSGHDVSWEVQRELLKEKAVEAAGKRKKDTRSSMITTVEEKKEGDVEFKLYTYYVKAGGWMLFFGVIIFVLVSQLFQILSLYWLSFWGQVSRRNEQNGKEMSTNDNMYYLDVFALLSVVSLICYVCRSLFLANHRLGTSSKLHAGLLAGTLRSPIRFFDSTPIGRILNRFSSDLLTVDEELSQTLSQATNSVGSVVGALAAIAGATKGTFLLLFLPLVFIYNQIQKYFRSTNTAVARLESISRSPIYSDFSQVLSGVSTVRAYGDQNRFIKSLEASIDGNSAANMLQQLCSQWLAVRLDFLGSLISFFVALIAASTTDFIPAGFLALGLSYSFQLTQYMKFLVRMIATLESQMNSVERIRHYMTSIDREVDPSDASENAVVPSEWPSKGTIEVDSIEMRYADGPLVLKDVSFRVEAQEKVGLVGRTGSGKSSIIVALYRFQKLASGSIKIDGLNIAEIPLKVLRSRLGIIPQDPVMFSTTVRFNLDPFNLYTDVELWDVLASVNMKDHVSSLPGKLDEEVAEGGDNFSAGQRQLICIARAILRKPKILFLDEATASIDNETDALVQSMIRVQFKECTVLTIAHRLHTVVDSDRIMVLDDGKLVEFDTPSTLLAKEDGHFKSLWDKHQQSHQGQE